MDIKTAFGEPSKGIHFHCFGFAVVDDFLTILLAIVLQTILSISFLTIFLGLFVIGELLHLLFKVETTVIKFIKFLLNK